jgi:hypothetical protein
MIAHHSAALHKSITNHCTNKCEAVFLRDLDRLVEISVLVGASL